MEISFTEDIKKLFRLVKNFFLDLLTINGGIYFYTPSSGYWRKLSSLWSWKLPVFKFLPITSCSRITWQRTKQFCYQHVLFVFCLAAETFWQNRKCDVRHHTPYNPRLEPKHWTLDVIIFRAKLTWWKHPDFVFSCPSKLINSSAHTAWTPCPSLTTAHTPATSLGAPFCCPYCSSATSDMCTCHALHKYKGKHTS